MPADIAVILLIPLLYGIECLRWSGAGTAYFCTLLGKRWRARPPVRVSERAGSGLFLLFPLPPLGFALPAHPPAIAFSPEGLCRSISESDTPVDGPAPQPYLYEEIETVLARDREIVLNGRTFSRARSKDEAGRTVEFVTALKRARPRVREEMIVRRLDGLFRRSEITARVETFKAKTVDLLILCNGLWLLLVPGLPAALYVYGFSRAVLPPLAAALALHLIITGLAFKTRRDLYGPPGRPILYALLPSPFNSVRAVDLLARDLIAPYHPYAAAAALLTPERLMALVRPGLAKLRHPLRDDRASDLALRIDRWHTARLIARIEKAIEAAGLDPAGLAVPAASDDDGLYSSYCPRCLCRYQKEGECPDCAGVPLVRMP